jgi:cytochrome P450
VTADQLQAAAGLDFAGDELMFNPFDPDFRAEPYPFYKRLREADPVHLTPLGNWILTRYEDVNAILRDPRLSSDFRNSLTLEELNVPGRFEDDRQPSMLFLDPPDHTRLRNLVHKAFTARRIERLRERVHQVVDELLGAARDKGEMDVVDDLAYPLPVTIICDMLGVPVKDQETFAGWSLDLVATLDPIVPPDLMEKALESSDAFREYFLALIPERRAHPTDDLLSALIAAEDEGNKLTEDELLVTLILLLVAGHETTVNLISNGTLALLRNRDQLELLRSDPALARPAIEELLRYDSPVQFIARIPMEDIEIGGKKVQKGRELIGVIAAANRDPAQFADPEKLDVTRQDNRHLAFSGGAHFCLGASLARLEGQIAITSLLREFPKIELAGDPQPRATLTLKGLSSLPVSL